MISRTVASTVAAVAVIALVVAAGAPARSTHDCVSGNELWFRAADGTQLVGHRFGGRRPGGKTAVVMAHMSEGSLCDWLPEARRLAARGFFAFPFDFRGYGFSKGRRSWARASADVAAAVTAVRRLGARKVVLVGASLGGIASVVAAATVRPPVAGVVSVSGPARIERHLDALRLAPQVRVPVLYLVAEDDRSGTYDFAADARRLFEATSSHRKRLEILPGTDHGIFLVERSPRARTLVEAFARNPPG
jgi:pimeloyl-ACP methyl ester carboxylesterase